MNLFRFLCSSVKDKRILKHRLGCMFVSHLWNQSFRKVCASLIHMFSRTISELHPHLQTFRFTSFNRLVVNFRTYVLTIFLIPPISTILVSITAFRFIHAIAWGAFEFVLSASCKNRTCSISLFLYFCFRMFFFELTDVDNTSWEKAPRRHRERVSRRQIDRDTAENTYNEDFRYVISLKFEVRRICRWLLREPGATFRRPSAFWKYPQVGKQSSV